jgi:uncharacterized protein with NRDE domain
MCLIFLSLNAHPDFKLIIAGNRDEFYQRQTSPAHFWEDHPDLLAGRDLEAGGTWMGITKKGKISLVTNYRDLYNLKSDAPSRGHLVTNYLLNGDQPGEYLNIIAETGSVYNGFNLIVGNSDELHYYSNYRNGVEKIPNGVHGLSNHLLNTPWPKVERGLVKFKTLINTSKMDASALFEALYDEELASDDKLPDTGIGLARERMLSSMFIKSPGYGSRSTTIITVDRNNNVLFSERVYDLQTFEYYTKTFEFTLHV